MYICLNKQLYDIRWFYVQYVEQKVHAKYVMKYSSVDFLFIFANIITLYIIMYSLNIYYIL